MSWEIVLEGSEGLSRTESTAGSQAPKGKVMLAHNLCHLLCCCINVAADRHLNSLQSLEAAGL